MTNYRILTDDQLRSKAPSIFADRPWEGMSDRYTFIPTSQVVKAMRDNGFEPTSARQSGTRIEGKGEFTKHQIRFQQHDANAQLVNLGGLIPEVILTNSHDGGSAYKLHAGLFRFVCFNGLVVGDTFAKTSVRHSGSVDGILEATFEVVEEFPKILESAESFGKLQLTAPQREVFAEAALQLRYDDGAPVTPRHILQPKRTADRATDLFTTMNVVQEHLTQGGASARNPQTRRRASVRAVTGIAENTNLNRAIWTLTERMGQLLAA